jgi:hypothetical protein
MDYYSAGLGVKLPPVTEESFSHRSDLRHTAKRYQ